MQEYICIHEKDLPHYAGLIAAKMHPGLPVLLHGPVGAGKSTFARAVLRILIPDLLHIPSPSFPIVIPYTSAIGKIWHMDLYRIEKKEDIDPLGLEEMMAQDRCLIEWPERLEGRMPKRYISVGLNFAEWDGVGTESAQCGVDAGRVDAGRVVKKELDHSLKKDWEGALDHKLENGGHGNLYRYLNIDYV